MQCLYLLLAVGVCYGAYLPQEEEKVDGRSEARSLLRSLYFTHHPTDCYDIQQSQHSGSGVYTIYPAGTVSFKVRCDLTTVGGGWTVIQRRVSSSNFEKTWTEYQVGFGNLVSNYWLGNEQIHAVTKQGWYELRVDMWHPDGGSAYAGYNKFEVDGAASMYSLTVDGYHGTAGDSLTYHNGRPFSASDRDNDAYSSSCSTLYKGGWWYGACHQSNLNGDYGNVVYGQGLNWLAYTTYTKSLTRVEMKVRRWMA